MCGIFGIVALDGRLDPAAWGVPDETGVLRHRGPDGHGSYLDSCAYLGHRRLSIIDLATGDQPIFNEDRTKCIVFNGEIYNFPELTADLEARGHRFRTKSDTEAIVHAFEEWGDACVERLRGMFAFAVWDSVQRRLLLARDRLGIKPVFYSTVGNTLIFASEMKAIARFAQVPRELDLEGVACFLRTGYIAAPLTIYRSIRKLPAGHTLSTATARVTTRKYWDLRFDPDPSVPEAAHVERVSALLQDAVESHLISDVPIGVFLSGGIDSSAVVALMHRLGADPVRTFSIGFGGEVGGYLDERPYAREVAAANGCEHLEVEVEPRVSDLVREVVAAFDEPFGDPSVIPTWHVSRVTRQHVKVALSGLGGDENFAGYERYLGFRWSEAYGRLPMFLRSRVARWLVDALPERADGHYTINHLKRFVRAAEFSGGERYLGMTAISGRPGDRPLVSDPAAFARAFEASDAIFLDHFRSAEATTPLERALYCDMKTYLPEDILACTDRMSMAHSLEVRVPFLDHPLVEYCARVPSTLKIRGTTKKYLLRRAVRDLVPESVLRHRKQGFIGPMTRWLQTDLRGLVHETLGSARLARHGLFDPAAIAALLAQHAAGREIHDRLVWSLVIFQSWYEMQASGRDVASAGCGV